MVLYCKIKKGDNIMKRLLTVILIFAFLFSGFLSFYSMAQDNKGPKKIGILWIGKSGMANRVLNGVKLQLQVKAPDMQIEIKPELAKEEQAGPVYQEWLKSKDAIVFLRSNGAQYVAQNKPSIPVFIGGCNNPLELGAVKSLTQPEGNITGVTYFLDASQHFKIYSQIFPGLSSIGLILEDGHPGSIIDRESTKSACADLGIKYNEVLISGVEELETKIAALASRVDLLVISNTGLIIDNAQAIAKASGTKPVASYAEAPVTKKHALIGFVPSDEKLGRMLGDSIVDVLVKGKKISQVPIKMDDQPTMVISAQKMMHWKVKIPFNLLKVAKVIK
jgi:putative ABC transport system substrate-binding protein